MVRLVNVKEQARRLLEGMPDEVTWDDLIHHFYVQQKLALAEEDVKAGRVSTTDEVRERILGPDTADPKFWEA